MRKDILTVVKIGGNVIDNPEVLASFLKDFSSIAGPKILVHGGGKIATSVAGKLGVKTEFIEGRRVTTPEMIDVVLMVYAGMVNKKIVATLNSYGIQAIGLSGADASVIIAHRRPATPINYGEVGDVDKVDARVVKGFIDSDYVPVFCSVTMDRDGNLLNTNADTIAESVAIGMGEYFDVRLIYCFEKDGVMTSAEGGEVIPYIDSETFSAMKEDGRIAGGMIPKIANALKASSYPGVIDVIIKNSDKLLIGSGTVISAND